MGDCQENIFGHLQQLLMKSIATTRCVHALDQRIEDILVLYHRSLVKTTSAKLEADLRISICSIVKIHFGMARGVALRIPAAVLITHPGSVNNSHNQLLMTLS